MKQRGITRLEVRVKKTDAALVRSVAAALADPERETATRELLLARFNDENTNGLKALLAAAPLEGIDLKRPRDRGRKVPL